ncbi:hypothetical protein ACHAQA_002469 [Verticillium albo-atrum]
MTKEKAQGWANHAMPSSIDKITVGAAIVRTGKTGRSEILLLKRAAHETYYPGVFEIPGGKVDDSDASIRDAVVREVHEETGLAITKIVNSLTPFVYTTEKQVGEGLRVQIIRRVAVQLSYLVEVEGDGDDFAVNEDEHSEADFVQELYLKELKAYKTPAVKESDAQGQVQTFNIPKTPTSPEEADLASSLQEYESMAVEVEGQEAASIDSPASKQSSWLVDEDEPAAAAH